MGARGALARWLGAGEHELQLPRTWAPIASPDPSRPTQQSRAAMREATHRAIHAGSATRGCHALAGLPRGQPRRCAARTATPPTLNCRPPAPTSASQSGLLCRHSAGGTARPPALGWLGLPHGQSGLGTARRPACLAWVCHAGSPAPGLLSQHSRAIVTAPRQTRCENGEFPTSSAAAYINKRRIH